MSSSEQTYAVHPFFPIASTVLLTLSTASSPSSLTVSR
jgi:hypothetical protein